MTHNLREVIQQQHLGHELESKNTPYHNYSTVMEFSYGVRFITPYFSYSTLTVLPFSQESKISL